MAPRGRPSQHLNRDEPGRYTFDPFEEEGWAEDDCYDHQIRVNYYDIIYRGQRCRYYY
jgi:hypothetical protein